MPRFTYRPEIVIDAPTNVVARNALLRLLSGAVLNKTIAYFSINHEPEKVTQ